MPMMSLYGCPYMSEFATKIIHWQKQFGRHDLPWQNTQDPYAIWVSEIMLQQTQVSAVIGYYQRFMSRFPNIASLANAEQEEVMQYWSGLGYYSRARNLHHAAQTIMDEHAGVFPQDFDAMQSLSGIGRSTAAAIAAFAFKQIHTILDGNVKRILARHFVIEGWPSSPKVEKAMWQLADTLLPKSDMVAYTQGLMDLGATLCTRSQPKCTSCPLIASCGAYAQGLTKSLPTPKPRKTIPQRHTTMLILQSGNEVLLEKRPPSGIWGGLWSLPEIDKLDIASEVALSRFGLVTEADEPLDLVQHSFTHFKLEILPQPLQVISKPHQLGSGALVWLALEDAIGAALPSPVRNILLKMQT
jgi:A/G-specific adenine glycosylase